MVYKTYKWKSFAFTFFKVLCVDLSVIKTIIVQMDMEKNTKNAVF